MSEKSSALWRWFGKPLLWALVIIFGMSFLGMFAKVAYVKWLVYQSVQNMEAKAERDERGRRLDGEPIKVPFVGQDLYIPANYFALPQYDYDRVNNVSGLLLMTLWPGLEPRTTENREDFAALGGGRTLSIGVRSVADVVPERREKLLVLYLEGKLERTKYESQERRNGLEVIGDRFGLDYDGTVITNRQKDDVLFIREDGNVRSLLECAPEPPQFGVRSPRCRHTFIMDDIDAVIGMGYRREYLPDWLKIETEVAALIRSFYPQPAAADKEE